MVKENAKAKINREASELDQLVLGEIKAAQPVRLKALTERVRATPIGKKLYKAAADRHVNRGGETETLSCEALVRRSLTRLLHDKKVLSDRSSGWTVR